MHVIDPASLTAALDNLSILTRANPCISYAVAGLLGLETGRAILLGSRARRVQSEYYAYAVGISLDTIRARQRQSRSLRSEAWRVLRGRWEKKIKGIEHGLRLGMSLESPWHTAHAIA